MHLLFRPFLIAAHTHTPHTHTVLTAVFCLITSPLGFFVASFVPLLETCMRMGMIGIPWILRETSVVGVPQEWQ